MSVKAVALVNNVDYDASNSGKFVATVVFAGIEPGSLVHGFIYVDNVDPAIAAVSLEQALKQAVKDELVNNHGYSFGLFDSVRLVGALL
jgi:hypothetical protein